MNNLLNCIVLVGSVDDNWPQVNKTEIPGHHIIHGNCTIQLDGGSKWFLSAVRSRFRIQPSIHTE